MDTINAAQLSWLLSTNSTNKVSKKDAHKMIYVAIQKSKGIEPAQSSIGLTYAFDYSQIKDTPDECGVDIFEKHSGVPLRMAIDDIQKNYLKRQATKRWILNYPDEVIAKSKNKLPNSIKIPYPLHTLLPMDVMKEMMFDFLKNNWDNITLEDLKCLVK